VKAIIKDNTFFYDSGVSVAFTPEEIEKIKCVMSTPRSPYEIKQQRRQVLPKLYGDFTLTQKMLFADAVGDARAFELFGDGPWMMARRYERQKERVK
jgi:hypothetical protein